MAAGVEITSKSRTCSAKNARESFAGRVASCAGKLRGKVARERGLMRGRNAEKCKGSRVNGRESGARGWRGEGAQRPYARAGGEL
eukprot:2177933-Pleurochrysis_carterae.AAC.1